MPSDEKNRARFVSGVDPGLPAALAEAAGTIDANISATTSAARRGDDRDIKKPPLSRTLMPPDLGGGGMARW
jgi:hypothetical protein